METLNIQSLLSSKSNLKNDDLDKLLKFYDVYIKDVEWKTLESFRDYFGIDDAFLLDNFYFGYKIPQIGKEFDLLYLGYSKENRENKFILNLELKSDANEEKILSQLRRNNYYLKATNRKVYLYTYVESSKSLYKLEDDKLIILNDVSELKKLLQNNIADDNIFIDSIFDPSNYLVSPFNNTEKFIRKEYFLTRQQEEIKKLFINDYLENENELFFSISGNAGTGKTLLIYDIASTLRELGKKVLILHCGSLNEGQELLIKEFNWNIEQSMYYYKYMDNFDIIIIDEVQRIRKDYLQNILDYNKKIIFSFDKKQCLKTSEFNSNVIEIIKTKTKDTYNKELTNKIRTNKEIADFITGLINRKRNDYIFTTNNIEVYNFYSKDDVKNFLILLANKGWYIPKYTPSRSGSYQYEEYSYKEGKSAHDIIGQEFDSIVVVIDKNFLYDEYGDLYANFGFHYSLYGMFYQIITRARKKLCIVTLNNDVVFNRCVEILSNR